MLDCFVVVADAYEPKKNTHTPQQTGTIFRFRVWWTSAIFICSYDGPQLLEGVMIQGTLHN
jgi:hypothetical protein